MGHLDLHLNYRGDPTPCGATLAPMEIRVWNLRVLRGEQIHSAGETTGILEVSLHGVPSNNQPRRIAGTITNHGDVPLSDLRIRVQEGIASLSNTPTGGSIKPGESLKVDSAITLSATLAPPQDAAQVYYYGRYGNSHGPAYTGPMLATAGDLAPARSKRIDQILEHDPEAACIYAQASNTPPACPLMGDKKPLEEHWRVVRALVRLSNFDKSSNQAKPEDGKPHE